MINKQKLLIVSRSTVFHNKSGGMETQLDNLIHYLKNYYDITVVTTALPFKRKPRKINQIRVNHGISYVFLKDTVPGEYGYNLYESLFWQIPIKRNFDSLNKKFTKKAAEYYKDKLQGKFSIILSQSSSAQNFTLSNKEKLILVNHGTTINEIRNRFNSAKGIKDFVRFIFLDFPSLIYEYFVNNPKLFNESTKIVLISSRVKKDFNHQHKGYKNKVVVIPNGINTKKFKPLKKNKKFSVVYAGRIDYEKGLDRFLEVAKELPEIKFEIYGDGPDVLNIKYQISNIKNLKYFGAVSNEKIAKIFGRSHVFLFLTKRREGMPMSILEALSSGCAVISTLKDRASLSKSGYVLVSSVSESISVLKKLRGNPSTFIKYSKLARNYAKNNYSYELMGKKYLDLLRS